MSEPIAGARPAIGLGTKLLYGSGAIANAIKGRGLSLLLLLFYNQVVGLSPAVVSTAIFVALIFDAFVDPAVGQFSDNFRSPWGRRHPFMYAAALPVSVAYFLIWNPPTEGSIWGAAWSEQALFAWMLTNLLIIRLFDTFFELPSSALAPELARDYDERTSLIAIRTMFGIVGGLGMTLAIYNIFMPEGPDGSGGITAPEGYLPYSIAAGLLIFGIILLSTWGTHKQIPWLARPPARKITLVGMMKEVGHTLNNRSFVAATLSGVFIAVAAGAKNGLELYFALYYWGFNQAQLSILTIIGVAASVVGVGMAPVAGKRFGKKQAAIVLFFIALLVGVTPLTLSLFGLTPPRGSDALFLLLAVETFVNTAFAVATGVMLVSMVADVVEDAEVKTGRRSEGLLMSADNLFKKVVSGLGVFISGQVLVLVNFPENARRTGVDEEILRNMALTYLPVVGSLYFIAILCLFLFKLDKATHEDNLRRLSESAALAEKAGADQEAGGVGGLAGGAAPSPART